MAESIDQSQTSQTGSPMSGQSSQDNHGAPTQLAPQPTEKTNNSDKSAQLNATQGFDIHVALGQEQHLPYEAWHVVQQAQGRVKPTMQMTSNISVNDDAGLEHEANIMGEKAQTLPRNTD